MANITVSIDSIRGLVKIAIVDNGGEKQTMELQWCVFDEDGSTGFLTTFSSGPIQVTDLAAEHFLRLVTGSLVRTFDVKPGDLTIINHIGEQLPDVQFLPPTFRGNEVDITEFVAKQGSILKLHNIYEEGGVLEEGLIRMAEGEGILDDFLSLVQVRASGTFLAVRKPSQ